MARVRQRWRCGFEMVRPAKPAVPTVTRGDVWLAALDPTVGSEIQKTRPCVVISPPEMHDHLRTVMVAPMTLAATRHLFASRSVSKVKMVSFCWTRCALSTNYVWCAG